MAFPKRLDSKNPILPEGPIGYIVGTSGPLMPGVWVQAETMLCEPQTTQKKLTELDQILDTLPKELINSPAQDDVSLLKVLESIGTPTKKPNAKNLPPLPKTMVNQQVFTAPRKMINRKRPREQVDLNLPKSKIPIIGVKRGLSYEEELDSVFAEFSAELFEAMRRYKSPKTAYNASRRVVQLHEQLQKL